MDLSTNCSDKYRVINGENGSMVNRFHKTVFEYRQINPIYFQNKTSTYNTITRTRYYRCHRRKIARGYLSLTQFSFVVPTVLLTLLSSLSFLVTVGATQHHPNTRNFPNSEEFDPRFLGRVLTLDLSGQFVEGVETPGNRQTGADRETSEGEGNTQEKQAMLQKEAAAASGTILRDGIVQRVPPSRPAPMYDKPTVKVTFDTLTSNRVLAAVGQTAYLHCRVRHLGNRVVTWIRKHDVHVLTVALFTYTTDDRFTALHSEASNDWTLRIASPQITDSGTYECQVSTEPSISRTFILQVVESHARIAGPTEIHMMSGSDIKLTCKVTGSPEPPQYIYWYAGTTLVNYSQRGGISVVTDKRTRTSWLVVARSTLADSGNYTCAPANAQPSSVSVYILSGEHPAAMQGGESVSAYSLSQLSVLVIAMLVTLYRSPVCR